MNVLTRELHSCLSQLTVGEAGAVSATFTFSPGFPGFNGHFIGNPVLPGVCMVQAVLVMLSEQRKSPVTLKRLVSAKWFAPVRPGTELSFVCHERADKLVEKTVKVHVACGGSKVADLSLLVLFGAPGKAAKT
jgi:3-hydroxyacyl-[acyl-carrier-protein] dehydratase